MWRPWRQVRRPQTSGCHQRCLCFLWWEVRRFEEVYWLQQSFLLWQELPESSQVRAQGCLWYSIVWLVCMYRYIPHAFDYMYESGGSVVRLRKGHRPWTFETWFDDEGIPTFMPYFRTNGGQDPKHFHLNCNDKSPNLDWIFRYTTLLAACRRKQTLYDNTLFKQTMQ